METGDCNICEVANCHRWKGFKNDCKSYLPPSIFKLSMFEHLLFKDSRSVLKLLSLSKLRVEPQNKYPGFILIDVHA